MSKNLLLFVLKETFLILGNGVFISKTNCCALLRPSLQRGEDKSCKGRKKAADAAQLRLISEKAKESHRCDLQLEPFTPGKNGR